MEWTQMAAALAAVIAIMASLIGCIKWIINASQASLHKDISDLRSDIALIATDIKYAHQRIDETTHATNQRLDTMYVLIIEMLKKEKS